MDLIEEFRQERAARVSGYRGDTTLRDLALAFTTGAIARKYAYNFTWLGRPIIQFPQDIVAMQELIWSVQPDLIIETGIAHGGSLIFSASMLQLLNGNGMVLGIDIDIRAHNRREIESHPLAHRIRMIQGSSVDASVAATVEAIAKRYQRVLVMLDSNHEHDHVVREFDLYAPLVSTGSYLVVFDTIVEDIPDELSADRPWRQGNNPRTAVREFLARNSEFEVDTELEAKLAITVAPGGYLKRVR